MASPGHPRIIALGLLLAAAGAGGYLLWPPEPPAPIAGVVRATEIRVAPEVGGQLAAIKVQKGDQVRAGDVVAELSALELTASVGQARAALAAATADRDHVYAGVRAEEVASLAAEIAKAKSRLAYVQAQLSRTSTLARSDIASQQALDQATNDVASARADVAEAEANHAAAVAGPTPEERAIADAQVQAAASALAVLERRLEKTTLRAPADGVVSVIVAEIGENVRAGQPVLAIEETGKQWLSFNAREDLLHGLTVGAVVHVARQGMRETMPAVVTELRPLGAFATWQAERAVGDHDRNTLRLRLDPQGECDGVRARHDGLAQSLNGEGQDKRRVSMRGKSSSVRACRGVALGHSGLCARQCDRRQDRVRESMCVLPLDRAWQAGLRSVARRRHGPAVRHAAGLHLYARDDERPPDLGCQDAR